MDPLARILRGRALTRGTRAAGGAQEFADRRFAFAVRMIKSSLFRLSGITLQNPQILRLSGGQSDFQGSRIARIRCKSAQNRELGRCYRLSGVRSPLHTQPGSRPDSAGRRGRPAFVHVNRYGILTPLSGLSTFKIDPPETAGFVRFARGCLPRRRSGVSVASSSSKRADAQLTVTRYEPYFCASFVTKRFDRV